MPTSPDEPSEPVDNGDFVFEKAQLVPYFPKTVIAHFCSDARRLSPDDAAPFRMAHGGGDFYRLLVGRDLPVVVAMRMSLNFPFVISVLPLWRFGQADNPAAGEPPSAGSGSSSPTASRRRTSRCTSSTRRSRAPLEDPDRARERDLRVHRVFHNRRRRHSSLGMLTLIEFELNKINTTSQAA